MANTPHKFKNGVAINGTATVNADEVATLTATQTLQNKTIDNTNTIDTGALPTGIDSTNIADGSVSNTEFQYINSLSSNAQDQLDAKEATANKNQANGYAGLDANSKILSSQIPAIAITEVFVVADITARDALTVGSGDGEVQEGDVVRVTDASDDAAITAGAASYIYDGAAYVLLKAGDEVLSVNGETGIVTLSAADVNAADQQLSNLGVTALGGVALNEVGDIIPNGDGVQNLGSGTNGFNRLDIQQLRNPNGNIALLDVLFPDVDNTLEFGQATNRHTIGYFSNRLQVGEASGDKTNYQASSIIHFNDEFLIRSIDADLTVQADTGSSVIINADADASKLANQPTGADVLSIATTKYVDDSVASSNSGSSGDLAEQTFSMANNQATAADVTGLVFANATVRSFEALVSVEIDATANLYEVFTLRGIQKGADWDMSVASTGDISNVDFTITSAGQVQYVSGNEAGFVSGDIKFRAITTTV